MSVSEHFLVFVLVWAAGLLGILLSVYALLKQKAYVDVATKQIVEMEFPGWFKFKSNVPALGITVVCAGLIGGTTYYYLKEPPRLSVSGQILMEDGRGAEGIPVGIVPGTYMTWTTSDGKYSLSIPRTVGGDSYSGLTFIPRSNPARYHISGINIKSDHGTFDYAFGGSR